jgi:ribosomal protein L3 glutamine methyltransferase
MSDLNLPAIDSVAAELISVRDFIRYAVSRFNRAGLVHGHGAFTAYDEAVFMVLETLKLPVDQLEPYLEARLLPSERQALASIIHERVTTRKPAAYLTKRTYIQGVPFYVDERTIVPRSFIGELLFGEMFGGEQDFTLVDDVMDVERVLDLCTGSGCLAILAAKIFPESKVDAVDLSPDALEVAKINVADHALEDRVKLFNGDLFKPLKGKKYDLIISNPPYVDAEAMANLPEEYQAEPRMALVGGGDDGMDIVHRILKEAPKYLNEGGGLLVEVGTGRAALEEAYPDAEFLWLETELSFGEVFWITKDQLEEL